jgi:beta-lactamase superfamily II metal-dependent hydrolase
VSPTGYGMMIDCGCAAVDSDKGNPIDTINNCKKWLSMQPYKTQQGESYPLGLLHITHPDDDHVRNAKRIKSDLPPYLLRRTYVEEFPDADEVNENYKKYIDNVYRDSNPENILWRFDENLTFQIPIEKVRNDAELSPKVRNNSSILQYIKYKGVSILFAGDLEKAGWKWLAENDKKFVETMKQGLDILIAPHHGHKSGFPKELFDLTGNVKVVIHSKGSEANKDGTDVASQYTHYADGITYKALSDKNHYSAFVLTTRSNGNIFIEMADNGSLNLWAEKASPNHQQV